MNNAAVFALRTVLKKEGNPDVRLEIRRSSATDFAIIVDGHHKGVIWKPLSSKDPTDWSKPFLIEDAFQSTVAKHYPGYSVTELEEGSLPTVSN